MASRHSESSQSSRTFGSRAGNSRRPTDDFWDFDLPISRKGRFFDDSFFESSRFDFDKKVNEILKGWGEDERRSDRWDDDDDDFRPSKNFSRYRNLRSQDLKDDNQALTVTSDDTAHKIVLDVQDFVNGEMKVKVIGERELAVEGRLSDNRSFRRCFPLPQNTDMEAVTSVMSADGILTITAPQKGSKSKDTTANKGSATSQANTKERCTLSSESRREGEEGGRHADAASRTNDSKTARSHQTSTSSGFRDVPFMKRGRFFDDSFFESSRFDFDKKVNEILARLGEKERLDRWDDDSDFQLNNFNRYKNLRARDLRDDNQAITVTSDDTTHKIVLDVHEFVNGEMKVKVIGERELAVEGRLDDNRSFRRCFPLPQNTDMEAVASVMSADGILTITAPQKGSQINKERISTQSAQANSGGSSNIVKDSSSTTQKTTLTSSADTKQREAQQHLSQGATTKTLEEDVTSGSSSVSGEAQQSAQSSISSQTETSAVCNATQTNDAANKVHEKSIEKGSHNKSISTQTSGSCDTMSEDQHRRRATLPIARKGQFFNDSYFEDTWKNYQDAVRAIVSKWDDDSAAATDDMTCYRRLRSRDMRDENQAITSTEDSSSYKFVLDVQDFIEGGNISVNVVDEMELVVEGQADKEVGGSKSLNHFLRRFILPEDVDVDSVSSVMSSDGVLTVIAPKKSSMRQLGDISVAEGLCQSSHQEKKLSQRAAQASTATASVSATEDVVIPVHFGASADTTSKVSFEKTQLGMTSEKNENLNDDNDCKKNTATKDCTFADEVEGVHRRLEEEGEEDESKSGMAALRRLLEEDETYIKNKNRTVPINNKGIFYGDTCFSHLLEGFLSAVKDILSKFRVPSSEGEDLAAYRGLRQRDLKLENQAAYVDEDTSAHTIALDVYDFLEGKLTAEVKDGRELIVRGMSQRREGASLITLTCVRPFQLPDNADLKNITAFLTSDGVLIINVPRLQLPYDLPDFGITKAVENRSKLNTPRDPCQRVSSERGVREASSDLDGVTYRISPH